MPRLPRDLHRVTTSRSRDHAISKKHATRYVWSAAPATQNDNGGLQCCACKETCNSSAESLAKVLLLSHKTTFDAFADTWKCQEGPSLPRKTTWQPAWKPSKRKGFAASPTHTATAEENQRIETRHVGASKRAFHARPPPMFIFCSFKINVFLRVFSWTSKFATSKSMFRARLPSLFITSHKMPRLPRNLHVVTTWHSLDNAARKNMQHDTSEVLRLPREMTTEVSKVLRLPRKLQLMFRKRRKSIAPATQSGFRHVIKQVGMSQSATPATRNEATRRLEPPKVTPFAKLAIGTAIATSRERLRTAANGCERLQTVANSCGRLRT